MSQQMPQPRRRHLRPDGREHRTPTRWACARCSSASSPQRDSQHLLVKAPPASGKSRALMFVGARQALQPGPQEGHRRGAGAVDRRVVREHEADRVRLLRRLGGQARATTSATPAPTQGKVGAFIDFLARPRRDARSARTRRCGSRSTKRSTRTRSTARVLAIDEFHHVSADREQPARRAAARR